VSRARADDTKKVPGAPSSPELPFTTRFESIGAWVPEQRLATADLMAQVKMRFGLDFEGVTGIRERRVCADGEDSYTLAVAAAEECLSYSSYAAGDMEMLICCSISKFKDGLSTVYEPPLSLFVKDALGATKALTFDVGNACAGMLTGVFILDSFIRRGVVKCGMVVSGEYITSLATNAIPHVETALSTQLASLTLGDCGAAAIMERAKPGRAGLQTASFMTLSRWNDLCIGGPCAHAPGGEMDTNGRKIHRVAIKALPPILEKALRECGLDYGDIDYFIPHQTSMQGIESGDRRFSKYFGAHPRNLVVNLEEYGNTASTSHFLAMYVWLKEQRFKPGERILLIALASGVVIGVVTFTMDELAFRYGHENPVD